MAIRTRIAPTAAAVREAVPVDIRANVKTCRFSVRVVVKGAVEEALRTLEALNLAGFCDASGDLLKSSVLSSHDGRHQAFIYKVV